MPQKKPDIHAITLKEHIYTKLFDGILRGRFASGQIITEKVLGEHFQVSKSPVREALIELCNEGVLRSIPRYGYEVVRLTDQDVKNTRDFRLILEYGTLDTYWQRINFHQIEEMVAKSKTLQYTTEKDVLKHWQNNSQFHLDLISCFNNKYIYEHLQQALRVQTRAYAQFYWDRWHSTIFTSTAELHDKILESILSQNKATTLQYLYDDIAEFPCGNTVSVAKNPHSSI